jgi:hypothetical protein
VRVADLAGDHSEPVAADVVRGLTIPLTDDVRAILATLPRIAVEGLNEGDTYVFTTTGRSATLIISQIPVCRWHDIIGEPTIADAIPDRIVHNAHRLKLKGRFAAQEARLAARRADDLPEHETPAPRLANEPSAKPRRAGRPIASRIRTWNCTAGNAGPVGEVLWIGGKPTSTPSVASTSERTAGGR